MSEAWRRKLSQVRTTLAVPIFLVAFTVLMILSLPIYVAATGQSWAFKPIYPGAVILTAQLIPVLFEELARVLAIAAAGLFGRIRTAMIAGLLLGLLEKSFHIGRLFAGQITVTALVEIALPTILHATLTAVVAKYARGYGNVAAGGVLAAAVLVHLYNNALLNWTARQFGIAPLGLGLCLAGLLLAGSIVLLLGSRRPLAPI